MLCIAGVQSGPAGAQQAKKRPTAAVPHQAVLHLQHADHSTVCSCIQSVLHLTAFVQALRHLLHCQAAGPMEGEDISPQQAAASHDAVVTAEGILLLHALSLYADAFLQQVLLPP